MSLVPRSSVRKRCTPPCATARLGGAALDVWWRYPTVAEPQLQPSRCPFHELPNVLTTPHCSSATDGTAERRWSVVADNLDRFVRGEPLANVVVTT